MRSAKVEKHGQRILGRRRRRMRYASMMDLIVIKLGSNIVCDADGEIRSTVLDTVCEQIAELQQGSNRVIMVTSGAIARGRHSLGIGDKPEDLAKLQACSAVGQGDLFRQYERRLADRGISTAQILLTSRDLELSIARDNTSTTLSQLLEWGVVPVINENDTTSTAEITFGDNDLLAAEISSLVNADMLLLLTNTDGVFSSDPREDPDAELVPRITSPEQLKQVKVGASPSAHGSGGMASKLKAAAQACAVGTVTVICNGADEQAITGAVCGKPSGTVICIPPDPPYQAHNR